MYQLPIIINTSITIAIPITHVLLIDIISRKVFHHMTLVLIIGTSYSI